MLHLSAGQSPRSVRAERPAYYARGAAIARLLLTLTGTMIFLRALATPYFAARLLG
jgi:hypothetical protein